MLEPILLNDVIERLFDAEVQFRHYTCNDGAWVGLWVILHLTVVETLDRFYKHWNGSLDTVAQI